MVVMIEWHYYLWSSSLLTTLTRAYPLHNNSVGFDIRGDIKIFDFGLAKELAHLEPDEKGLYKLTGMSKWSVGRSVGRSIVVPLSFSSHAHSSFFCFESRFSSLHGTRSGLGKALQCHVRFLQFCHYALGNTANETAL